MRQLNLKHLEFKVINNVLLMFEFLLFTPILEHDDVVVVLVYRKIFHTSASLHVLGFQIFQFLLLIFKPLLYLIMKTVTRSPITNSFEITFSSYISPNVETVLSTVSEFSYIYEVKQNAATKCNHSCHMPQVHIKN